MAFPLSVLNEVSVVPTSKNITDLTHLLTSCVDQLKLLEKSSTATTNNNDNFAVPFSSVYFQTLAALQDHAAWQLSQLQTQIQYLQTQQRDYQAACRQQQNELMKWETKVKQQKEEFMLLERKKLSMSSTLSSSSHHTQEASTVVGLSSSAPPSQATTTMAADADASLARPTSRNITTTNNNNSRQKSPKHDTSSNSHLTSLERQKKAAMEERQQKVLEQRRKAAEEQKRLKEQEHSKFLEYEQRKEELKLQAQREAEATKVKARQEEEAMLEAMRQAQLWQATTTSAGAKSITSTIGTSTIDPSSSHHPAQTLSPSMSHYSTPLTTTPSSQSQPTPGMSSPATRLPSSGSNTTNSLGSGRSGSGGATTSTHRGNAMEIPHLPHMVPPTSQNSNNSSSPRPRFPPVPQHLPTPHHHTPTGTDAKYSRMMSQQPTPHPTLSTANSSDQMDSPSQEAISSLRHNILLHWAVLPPNYQVLKPIPQLLCQIHTVLPPAFGVPPHTYFDGYTSKPIVWQDLVATTTTSSNMVGQATWDSAKLKKAVRTIRFFLHPDKLPHDLNGLQQFLCKLLWDVINDAFEDYQKQQQQQQESQR